MKIDIILAGVGGQGILSIASTIGVAAVKKGLYLKQAEVHGMSQRGGDVQSHFRLADYEIASDLIPMGKADLIIAVEPMESLRYLPWENKIRDKIIKSFSRNFESERNSQTAFRHFIRSSEFAPFPQPQSHAVVNWFGNIPVSGILELGDLSAYRIV